MHGIQKCNQVKKATHKGRLQMPVTEHTENVSKNKVYRRGSENAEKMSSNSPTPNKSSSNPEVIQVRSPHILSMMEERKVFTYSLRQHQCAEVAYQIRQTVFILGPDSPILEKLAKMSGKAAKTTCPRECAIFGCVAQKVGTGASCHSYKAGRAE